MIVLKVCGAIKGKLEILLHEARSTCQPGADNGKIAILLASSLPVFRSFEGKRAWFIASIGAVGNDVQAAGHSDFTTLYMIDSESAHSLDAYAMPIARVVQLQQQIKNGKLTSDAFVSTVMREMRPTKLPTRLLGR
jgi:hypothetical protein